MCPRKTAARGFTASERCVLKEPLEQHGAGKLATRLKWGQMKSQSSLPSPVPSLKEDLQSMYAGTQSRGAVCSKPQPERSSAVCTNTPVLLSVEKPPAPSSHSGRALQPASDPGTLPLLCRTALALPLPPLPRRDGSGWITLHQQPVGAATPPALGSRPETTPSILPPGHSSKTTLLPFRRGRAGSLTMHQLI